VSNKCFQKKKAREERLRREKHRLEINKSYPKISLMNEEVLDPKFLCKLKEAIAKIDYSEMHKYCPEVDPREFLKRICKAGTGYVDYSVGEGRVLFGILHLFIKASILKNLGIDFINSYMPEQGFRVYICKWNVFVICKRFHIKKHGRFEWFHNNKKVSFLKKEYNLYYSKHMFDRMLERLNYISSAVLSETDRFMNIADAFSNFYLYCDIAPYKIGAKNKDVLFMDIFDLAKTFEHQNIVDSGLKIPKWLPPSSDKKLEERSIYLIKKVSFPLICLDLDNDGIEDSFVVKSMLLAGFDGTPEYSCITERKLPDDIIRKIRDIMGDPAKRYGEKYIGAQLVFHRMGFPQFYAYNTDKNMRLLTRNVGVDFSSIHEINIKNLKE
jgi:hypothetical protein